jgi:hypothetical protein
MDARTEIAPRKFEGHLFVWVYAREGPAFSDDAPTSDDDFIHLPSALPRKFAAYGGFDSRARFAICAAAWRETQRLLGAAVARRLESGL